MRRRSLNIHERFLRHIWNKQYLTANLQTVDGLSLKILNVGWLNSDSGPDFHNAKIKIGGTTYSGDIEIHRTIFEWLQHQHQEDPRYNKVILHVVLEGANGFPHTIVQSGRKIPVFVLGNFLAESIHSVWQRAILDERIQKSESIRCYRKNNSITAALITNWLEKLAVERLELKLRRFEERLKQLAHERRMTVREKERLYCGVSMEGSQDEIPPPLPELTTKDYSKKDIWEQVLYEGLMEGLGYSKNREPFIRLSQSATLKIVKDMGLVENEEKIQALLFGAGGLIPKISSLKEKESLKYVRQLSRNWKILRASFRSELLHATDWQFFRMRPSNFPTIRLAAACTLIKKLLSNDIFRHIIQTLKSNIPASEKESDLVKLFTAKTNAFWHYRFNFDEKASKTVTALGNPRIREILINAVLPVSLLYARIFKDKAVREGALQVYRSLPAVENNSITQLMERQLIKGRLPLKSVCHKQAVIQLYKYYCTEGRCDDCEIGKSVFNNADNK